MLTAILLGLLSTPAAAEPAAATQAVASPAAAARARSGEDLDRMVCKSRPMLGSRIKQVKSCMTLAEWRATRNDKEQFRRDLNTANGVLSAE